MPNYETLTWRKGIWRDYLESTYQWVWENLRPEDNPDTFYVIVTNAEAQLEVDLAEFNKLVVIIDDPGKSFPVKRLVNPPSDRISLWYGLDEVPDGRWAKDYRVTGGLHFWDAYPFTVPDNTVREPVYDVFLAGNCKRERAKRLAQLLTGTSVSCVGFDWGEYFPVAKSLPREAGLLEAAVVGARECKTELVYHSPSVKSFLSLRLPNILRRGNVPLVDLDHDPNRKLLLTEKMRGICYVDTPQEVIEAADRWSEFSRHDIQSEYDAQVERAISDMSDLREKLKRMGR